jgi:hypothetical protein
VLSHVPESGSFDFAQDRLWAPSVVERRGFYRGFAAYLVSQKMGGRVAARLRPSPDTRRKTEAGPSTPLKNASLRMTRAGRGFERGFAAHLISQKMGGRFSARLKSCPFKAPKSNRGSPFGSDRVKKQMQVLRLGRCGDLAQNDCQWLNARDDTVFDCLG